MTPKLIRRDPQHLDGTVRADWEQRAAPNGSERRSTALGCAEQRSATPWRGGGRSPNRAFQSAGLPSKAPTRRSLGAGIDTCPPGRSELHRAPQAAGPCPGGEGRTSGRALHLHPGTVRRTEPARRDAFGFSDRQHSSYGCSPSARVESPCARPWLRRHPATACAGWEVRHLGRLRRRALLHHHRSRRRRGAPGPGRDLHGGAGAADGPLAGPPHPTRLRGNERRAQAPSRTTRRRPAWVNRCARAPGKS